MKADDVTEKEVLAVLNKFAELYLMHDMINLMSLFAPDNDVVVYGSEPDEKRVGLDEIKMVVDRDWSEHGNTSLEFNWISISSAGSLAWVAIDAFFKVNTNGQKMIYSSRITSVLEKREGKWLIVQGHFSYPDIRRHLHLF